ncbi:MAG: prenyltransferase [Actinomycetota bacterium]|nr:prenyltransferase [Actinomycetota bacterium]MDA2972997.1 prenyltransferase [Actinomycetota bacterium]MDA3009363.1 prenyltransferase [Actinomycetota bacterium]
MRPIDGITGVITTDELRRSGAHLASLQTSAGMIPWFPGGHCDPWNHVESAMALDLVGLSAEAERAYDWLIATQRLDGSWHNYYLPDGAGDTTVEDPKLDTNVCAYIATGALHHHLCHPDLGFVDRVWPTVERALDWVLSCRRDDGLALWAVHADDQPWEYALLTGTCSILHSLRSGAELARLVGSERPDFEEAAETMMSAVRDEVAGTHGAFEPKERWAMDWYYPALTGAIDGEAGRARLAEGFDTFVMEGLGVRCVSDEPWITASETAEASIAHAAVGEVDTATELLASTREHRLASGAYLTGIVHPERIVFPADEHTSYTAAAVILAVDAIRGDSPASRLFRHT